jgi:hypothetical protein
MTLSEKLAALAALCGPEPDPLTVRRRQKFLGFLPVTRFDTQLWVGDNIEYWRVMRSDSSGQITGVEFRKGDDDTPAARKFIAWKWEDDEWQLAQPVDAVEIGDRIEASIDHAYHQHCITNN